MRQVDPILKERLETLLTSMGYELVGCQLIPQGRQAIFRLYIDKENGVTIDDCSRVSLQVSAMMDVEDPIQGRYTLEVSSPGIDRPLFEINQYKSYIGRQVKIRLKTAVMNRRQYNGELVRVVDEDIFLLVDGMGQEIRLPFEAIEKANLVGDVQFRKKSEDRKGGDKA